MDVSDGQLVGEVHIAEHFNVPKILIDATVVSIGTTLPETMVSVQAALQGNAGISYGNAIGSIICNASLIAAIALIACTKIKFSFHIYDIIKIKEGERYGKSNYGTLGMRT